MVPKGWHRKSLCEIAEINPRKPDRPNDGAVSFIPMDAVSENAAILRLEERCYEDVEKGFTSFKDKDVLVAKITPCFENGKGAIAEGLTNGIGFGSTEFHVLRATPDTSSNFIYYLTNTEQFRIKGEANMQGSAGQKRVTTDYLKILKVLVPPLPEQRKIAQILSTWDKAIATTERLLTNRQQQKKALMQRLLTGKQRFAGFEGEWSLVPLETVAEVKGGKRIPKGEGFSSEITNHPYIRVTDMYMGGVKLTDIQYVSESVAEGIRNYTVTPDDLFISVAGTLGLVGLIPTVLDGANLTENANKISSIKCDKMFLLYVLMSPQIQNNIEADSTQNAQPKLALNKIRQFLIPLPSMQEQQRIASVLMNADAELLITQKQLDNLKQQKKALMQQLLTGKRRVKVDSPALATQ